MSDQIDTQDQELAAAMAAQELEELKAKAAALNIPYHPAISAPKLREKIAAFMAASEQPSGQVPAVPQAEEDRTGEVNADPVADLAQVADGTVVAEVKVDEETGEESTVFAPVESAGQKRKRLKAEAEKLVRIRVACMNPAKKEWHGEIFTVGNSAVGTLRKYVPFNNDEGWHVPQMILTMIQERQCQVFVNKKTERGVTVREGKLIKEFAVEIMPELTPVELRELARRQAMAAGQD